MDVNVNELNGRNLDPSCNGGSSKLEGVDRGRGWGMVKGLEYYLGTIAT